MSFCSLSCLGLLSLQFFDVGQKRADDPDPESADDDEERHDTDGVENGAGLFADRNDIHFTQLGGQCKESG